MLYKKDNVYDTATKIYQSKCTHIKKPPKLSRYDAYKSVIVATLIHIKADNFLVVWSW